MYVEETSSDYYHGVGAWWEGLHQLATPMIQSRAQRDLASAELTKARAAELRSKSQRRQLTAQARAASLMQAAGRSPWLYLGLGGAALLAVLMLRRKRRR